MLKNQLTPRNLARMKGISRVTWVGLWSNVLLCVIKIVAGYLANSRAVMADGVHSFTDLISNVIILIGVRFWVAPADEEHPYGHQRLESLVTLLIGIVLGIAGFGIAGEAIDHMLHPQDEPVGSILALAVAIFSVVSKELLFRWTLHKSKGLHSEAVEASAREHRADALASLPIVFTVAIAMFAPAWAIVDLWGALLVAAFIIHAAWRICAPALNVLLDKGADAELCKKIQAMALEVPGILGVHALRTRYMGRALQIDMHVSVNGSISVIEGNRIAHALEDYLCSEGAAERLGIEIYDVLPHIDPQFDPLEDSQEVR